MEKSEYLNGCQRRTIHPSTTAPTSTLQVLQCAYRTTTDTDTNTVTRSHYANSHQGSTNHITAPPAQPADTTGS